MLFDNANQVYLIPERLYNYRQRKTGITLRPFSNTNLDIVEAYLERYTYVTSKYPDSDILIKDAGRHLIDNFLYCFTKAFFGFVTISISAYLSNSLKVATIGSLPTNSGIRPNFNKSCGNSCS